MRLKRSPSTCRREPPTADGSASKARAAGYRGGPAGDLYVVTHVKPHRYFTRDGADVVMDLPITLTEATLGAEVTIPTPDGQHVKLKVAEGTVDGKVYKIPGKGAPKLKGKGSGDLKVKVRLVVPKNLSGEQKELLRRFDSARNDDVRAHLV